MPKVIVKWTTGSHGSTVSVVERGAFLSLRYTVNSKHEFTPLKHSDEKRAKDQARELSRSLANARASESGAPGARKGLTVSELLSRYKVEVSAHKKGDQPDEDERRRLVWIHVLGAETKAKDVGPVHVERFIAQRRQGRVNVPGVVLKAKVKPSTVDADVVYLQAAFNWARRTRLLVGDPLQGALRPHVPTQLRPMADADRAETLLQIAEWAHRLFPLFLTCVRCLGWRVSAVCKIDVTDIRFATTVNAPFGEVRKNWENDKEGVEAWLPMPQELCDALQAAELPESGPIFPSGKDAAKPWSRYYARYLLEKAEDVAGLDPIQGGDWHPYRRLWATERKPLPVPDVAGAGGWLDQRTLQKYQQTDPATTAAVMLFKAPKQTKPRTTPRTLKKSPTNRATR